MRPDRLVPIVLVSLLAPACAHRATLLVERTPMIDVRDQPDGGLIAFDAVVNATPTSGGGLTAMAMTGAFQQGFRDAAARHDDIALVPPDEAGTLVEVVLVDWAAGREESVEDGEPCAVRIDDRDATVETRSIVSVTSGLVVAEIDVRTAAGGVLIDDEITRAFRFESEGVISSFEACAEPLAIDLPQDTADAAGVSIAREIVAALVPTVEAVDARFDRCRGLDACDTAWRAARAGDLSAGLAALDEALATDGSLSDRQRAGLLYNRALLLRSSGRYAEAEADVVDALAQHDGGRRWRALRADVRRERMLNEANPPAESGAGEDASDDSVHDGSADHVESDATGTEATSDDAL